MASYQRHVGPWPIKRSQSVPDTSVPLFTPCNTPPSLEQLLTKVDEECPPYQQSSPASGSRRVTDKGWLGYSMHQPRIDLEQQAGPEDKDKPEDNVDLSITHPILVVVHMVAVFILFFAPVLVADASERRPRGSTTDEQGAGKTTLDMILLGLAGALVGLIWAISAQLLKWLPRGRSIFREDVLGILFQMGTPIVLLAYSWTFYASEVLYQRV